MNYRSIRKPKPKRSLRSILMLILLPGAVGLAGLPPVEEKPAPVFSGERAYALLLKQCEFGPRDPGSARHRACGDYLVGILRELADKVAVQPFPMTFGRPPKTVEARNIIARFRPESKRRILFCAHWDTRPWADKDPDPKNHNRPILGANDGASGVAVLLEIARLLHDNRPPLGVDIVLFDGEDAGEAGSERGWIQGSVYFARHLETGRRPEYAVLLDMIGDADLQIYQESSSLRYARPLVDRIWRTAARLGLKSFISRVKYSVLDDHLPLLEAGIPAADLIDFDYPPWHTMADTPDKCSAASLEQVGRLVIELIFGE